MLGFLRRKPKSLRFRKCLMCGAKNYRPRGNGEIVERWGRVYIRQYHQCRECGTRYNLVRTLNDDLWSFTTDGAGIRAR